MWNIIDKIWRVDKFQSLDDVDISSLNNKNDYSIRIRFPGLIDVYVQQRFCVYTEIRPLYPYLYSFDSSTGKYDDIEEDNRRYRRYDTGNGDL